MPNELLLLFIFQASRFLFIYFTVGSVFIWILLGNDTFSRSNKIAFNLPYQQFVLFRRTRFLNSSKENDLMSFFIQKYVVFTVLCIYCSYCYAKILIALVKKKYLFAY